MGDSDTHMTDPSASPVPETRGTTFGGTTIGGTTFGGTTSGGTTFGGTTFGGTPIGGTTFGGTSFGGPSSSTTSTSSPAPTTTQPTSDTNGTKKKKKGKKKKETSDEANNKTRETAKEADKTGRSDLFDSDDEGTEDYKKGGYHPVKIGEVYKSNYKIVKKLGWGHFSTVWLALDESHGNREVALKIVKSASHYKEAAEDEIHLLKTISEGDPESKHCVVILYDSFLHTGPHGKHICMVFEKLGSNLLDLIKLHDYKGIPLPLVKCITKQVLIGLDYLHTKCKIIHTDLKPENVLLDHLLRPDITNWAAQFFEPTDTPAKSDVIADDEPPRNGKGKISWEPNPRVVNYQQRKVVQVPVVKIADLGTACWVDKHFTDDVQTRQYRSPEVIMGQKWDTTIDMWSLACMVFELATGDLLFCPKKGERWDKTDDHLALMMELLGKMPRSFTQKGSKSEKYFNSKGELKYIRKLGPQWGLADVLYDKYKFPKEEADQLASFLLPMLEYDPEKRATAKVSLVHPFLDGAAPFL